MVEDVEDAYTLFVLIQGLPEALFWNADWSFVQSVAADKLAYEAFVANEKALDIERQEAEAKRKARRH